jgi:hypothetical protein
VLIREAGRLAGIAGVLIHGRQDLSCPAETAWALARAWPEAELLIDDGSGHRGSKVKRELLLAAHARFDPWRIGMAPWPSPAAPSRSGLVLAPRGALAAVNAVRCAACR